MKHQRGQSTAEYAILIGVVIGALVAMQTYVKRGQQGRLKAVVDFYTAGNEGTTDGAGVSITRTLGQYEPYYQESSFDVGRASETTENIDLSVGTITKELTLAKPETTVRKIDGYQTQLPDEQRD